MVQRFKTGDLVQLKSGGPAMSVKEWLAAIVGDGDYSCQWFSGTTLKEGIFPADSLKGVEVTSGGELNLAEKIRAARKRTEKH